MARRQGNAESAAKPAAASTTAQQDDLSPDSLASAGGNTAGLQATGDEPVAALWVRSVSDQGFRRCGIRFSPEGRYIREDDLDEEQLKELVNDRSLVVEATWYSEKDLG